MAEDGFLSAALGQMRAGDSAGGYLGSVDVADTFLRGFIMGVINSVRSVATGEVDRAASSAAILCMCSDAAGAFLGRDPRYAPVGPWNTDGQIATFCRDRMEAHLSAGSAGDPVATMTEVFAVLVGEVYGVIQADQDGATDEDTQDRISGLVVSYRDMLLGLPAQEG